jgi:hypothetical protein
MGSKNNTGKITDLTSNAVEIRPATSSFAAVASKNATAIDASSATSRREKPAAARKSTARPLEPAAVFVFGHASISRSLRSASLTFSLPFAIASKMRTRSVSRCRELDSNCSMIESSRLRIVG